MPESQPPIALQGIRLNELQALIAERKLPPVDRWDPPFCGHSKIRIARDGTWFHEGEVIERPALVRLFSTVLRREADGTHMLVTPVEKLAVDVDCTAFRAVQMSSEGDGEERRIAFTLDSGDAVILGPEHPLTFAASPRGSSPRVTVRFGLEAELSRAVYYELAELAIGEGASGLWSDGVYFSLDQAE